MAQEPTELSCEEFQTQLPDLISSGVDVADHTHAKTCQICAGLIRDLDRIAKNAGRFQFGVDEDGADDWSEST